MRLGRTRGKARQDAVPHASYMLTTPLAAAATLVYIPPWEPPDICIAKSANPVFEETTMAAKKAAAAILKFKKEWIFDPPPPFLNIDRAALIKINQLKAEFVKNVNAAIEAGQIR